MRAWVLEGKGVLAPEEIRAHQLLPTREQQAARAEFTLAWHLHRAGRQDAAERHFRRAGELAPRDWTIRRGSLPIRGIDPMASEEFLALWQEGVPRYPAPPLPGAAGSPWPGLSRRGRFGPACPQSDGTGRYPALGR